jgi:hypothetical protein
MPCPSAGPKIVCAGPSFVRPKWFTYCFCAGLKDDLHLVNSVLEPPQKMFGAALKAIHFFCLAQCMYVLGIYFLVMHIFGWYFEKTFRIFLMELYILFSDLATNCGPDYARFKNKHIVEQCPTKNVSELCNLSFWSE